MGHDMTHDPSRVPPADFDFEIGHWHVAHHRLRDRLVGSSQWDRFRGQASTRKVLGGWGNLEDNLIHLPGGSYHALALRSFDPATRQWSIWWLDGRSPMRLDVPVVGAFDGGVGTFHAQDVLDQVPIRIRFRWFTADADRPRWEQAFSADQGATWEINWTMEFTRQDPPRATDGPDPR